MSYRAGSQDATRGHLCEKAFEQWCDNQGFYWQKTDADTDKKYHVDYYVQMHDKKVAVDVKNFAFDYNESVCGMPIRIFEWTPKTDGAKSFLNKITFNRLTEIKYINQGGTLTSVRVFKENICWSSWTDSHKDELKVDVELVAFIKPETKEVWFMDRANNNIVNVLKKLWEEHGADSTTTYSKPQFAKATKDPCYKFCGNQNDTKGVVCMWVNFNDIEPYMMKLDDLYKKYFAVSEKSSTFAVFS